MNPTKNEENSQEDHESLGPGSLEDLGSSEWLQRFTATSKKHPRYDLGSNKGPFLAGLRFMLERFHEGSSAETITMTLKNKNRNFSLAFVRELIDFIPGDVIEIDQHIGGFALVLEFNRMGKSIPFIQERLEHIGRFGRFGRSFREAFLQELILNEKQWELETLVDIHRQESLQSVR